MSLLLAASLSHSQQEPIMTTKNPSTHCDDYSTFEKDYDYDMDADYGAAAHPEAAATGTAFTGPPNINNTRASADDSSPPSLAAAKETNDNDDDDNVMKDAEEAYHGLSQEFQACFFNMFNQVKAYHHVARQTARAWDPVQANEHAEADRLDQVEPDIVGLTAQFDEYAQQQRSVAVSAGGSGNGNHYDDDA
jgi:hypothetical protein